MGIYDLNDIGYLKHDIENILNRISQLYKTEFRKDGNFYFSKTVVDNKHHWASQSCRETFNNIIPAAKSLHKDMYAVIENIFIASTGEFDTQSLEQKYPHLKPFRLLNNKLKHFNKAQITLVQLVVMESQGHFIDIYCNFKSKDKLETLRFCDFIDTFLKILEDKNIISIERT